jgi:hypothetical protein
MAIVQHNPRRNYSLKYLGNDPLKGDRTGTGTEHFTQKLEAN